MRTSKGIEVKLKAGLPYVVAVDIGFGGLKLVSNELQQPMIIPSTVVAGAKPSSSKLFELDGITEENLIVTTQDGTFFVGQQAMVVPTISSKRTQARDRANDTFSRVLFQTGIAMGVPNEAGEYEVALVTGLPNDDYELTIKDKLEEFLNKPFTVEFHLSETRIVKKDIKVVSVDILRQPEGSVTYDQFAFDEKSFLVPSPTAAMLLGVIDFGHVTTDYALFQDGVIIEDDTVNGSTVGVTEVYNRLKRKLTVMFDKLGYDYRATDQDLDIAVRTKQVSYAGQTFDVSKEVEDSAREVAKSIAKSILEAWGNETNRLERILVTGGGAHIFAPYLEEEFAARRKQKFTVASSSQFSNVIGFYMYACIIQAETQQQRDVFTYYINPVFSKEVA